MRRALVVEPADRRSREGNGAKSIRDFDLAFAYEALARAHAVAGDRAEATRWLEQAHRAAAEVAEDDDRELLLSDLATIPALL